jgi:hypothetical protein
LYYSTGWQVLEERRGGTADSNIRRQYFWSIDYVDALTARVDYASGTVSATYHAQYDANWNVTAIADASTGVLERYIYDPYGTATVLYANWSVRGGSPYGWNYLHQGGRFDVDSNLYHFRHRDYSATLGRWTQSDPIGFDAGDLNLYRYEGNGPGNGVDPWGLDGSFWDSGWLPWNAAGNLISGGYDFVGGVIGGMYETGRRIIRSPWTFEESLSRNYDYTVDLNGMQGCLSSGHIYHDSGYLASKDMTDLMETTVELGAAATGGYGPGYIGRGGGAFRGLPIVKQLPAPTRPWWKFGPHKKPTKWQSQMMQRGWTNELIDEAYACGERFKAPNFVNKGNPATRYVHPKTNQFIVADDVTGDLLQVGGPDFGPKTIQ